MVGKRCQGSRRESGFSLVEFVVTLALAGAIGGIAVANVLEMQNPARNGAGELVAFLKQARARAISTTSSILVRAPNTNTVLGEVVDNCDSRDVASLDDKLTLLLSDRVGLTSVAWSVCYGPRGFSDTSLTIPLEDAYGAQASVELFLGGAVRELE